MEVGPLLLRKTHSPLEAWISLLVNQFKLGRWAYRCSMELSATKLRNSGDLRRCAHTDAMTL